jgi:tumor protein p53-inducible nuclear protein 1
VNAGDMTKSSVSPPDWVIVDRSEEADRLIEKTDMATSCMLQSKHETTPEPTAPQQQQQQPAEQPEQLPEQHKQQLSKLMESTTTILGSFFERHADEDEDFNRKYKSADWLITPLPCLTSITQSERSIVDNDPLENLLIEHPSMSVFVAATSSASNSDTSFIEEDEDEEEMMTVDEPVKKLVVAKQPTVLVKSVSEKRRPSPNNSIASHDSSPNHTLKRKQQHKKNKKSVQQQHAEPAKENKENVSVPLTAEFFKKQSNAARVEALLLNKNQMKRSNKNSVFASAGAKNANAKHRKYHKLQQPACFQSSKPVF